MRFLLIPFVAALGFARTVSPGDVLDVNQAIKLESPIPCDGSTNPQQEIVLDAHFSSEGGQRVFIVDNYRDQSCKADIGVKCFKHVPAGWRDDLIVNGEGSRHYWLNSCRAWGSKDAAQYTLSGWYKDGPATKKKLAWKQAPLKQVSTAPEVYEFSDGNGGTGRVEIKRR